MVERKEYMDKIKSFMNKDLIKVITGVRRSGKSYFLKLIVDDMPVPHEGLVYPAKIRDDGGHLGAGMVLHHPLKGLVVGLVEAYPLLKVLELHDLVYRHDQEVIDQAVHQLIIGDAEMRGDCCCDGGPRCAAILINYSTKHL